MRGGSRAGHPAYNSKGLGRHIIVELYGCNPEILSDADTLLEILTEAAVCSGATIIGKYVERFDGGGGVSAIVVIKESHISLHTWPELRYASLDIFTCGENTDPWKSYEFVIEKMRPASVSTLEIVRGLNVSRGVDLRLEAGGSRGG
ncbi:MAG: adenosylmethionine decarboxylase [Nitrososphaerota archaeon]